VAYHEILVLAGCVDLKDHFVLLLKYAHDLAELFIPHESLRRSFNSEEVEACQRLLKASVCLKDVCQDGNQ
jgi:hypothetical protein